MQFCETKPNFLRRSFARNELRSACHVPVVANEPNSRVTRGLSNDRLRWSISGDPSGPPNGSGCRGARLDLARRIAPLRRVVETRPHPEVRGRSPAGGRKKDATIEAKSDQHKALPLKGFASDIRGNWQDHLSSQLYAWTVLDVGQAFQPDDRQPSVRGSGWKA